MREAGFVRFRILMSLFAFPELKKLQSTARDHFQKIFSDHEKMKSQLETQKKELELRGKELEKREAQNESDRKKLLEELEEVKKLALYLFVCFSWHKDHCNQFHSSITVLGFVITW